MIQWHTLRGLAVVVLLLVPVLLGASPVGLHAQPAESGGDPPEPRLRIALALSGGGALGMAHVGVLSVLEELRVPVDCLAGTSMGALVGGFYATGIPAAGLHGLIETQQWADVFSDRSEYRDLPFRRKQDESRYLVDLQLGLSREGVSLPSGLVTGQDLFFLLQRYTLPVVEIDDFSQLPIPFVTIGTDLETGEAVLLTRGDLATAIRASMSIPGLFSPVDLDGRLLVDGGVANNLPVEEARRLCDADIVIAVDVTEPLANRQELTTQMKVSAQTLAFLTRREVDRQLQDAQIVIRPDVEQYGVFSFQDALAIVAAGVEAAQAQLETLAPLSLSEADYVAHRAGQQRPPPPRIVPSEIRFVGSQRIDERTLRQQVLTRTDQPLDLDILREDLGRLYNLNEFQRVTFRLEDGPRPGDVLAPGARPVLVFELEDRELGTTYLQFGVAMSSDLRGETGVTALVNATRTWLNQYGAEWRSDLRVGEIHGLFSELYQPLSYGGHLFVVPWIDISQQLEPIFDGSQRVAEYDVERYFTGFAAGLRLGRVGELRAGVVRGKAKAEAATGAIELPVFDVDIGGFTLNVIVDDVDRPIFARQGWSLVSDFFSSRAALGADEEYERLQVKVSGFASSGDNTFALILGGGTDFDSEAPFYDWFPGGGANDFAGVAAGQFRGRAFATARLLYYHQIMTLSPTLGRGVYAGLVLDAGNYWQDQDSVDLDDLRTGFGVFVGADTVLGPVLFGYGRADGGEDQFYFTIGQQLAR